ncbi:MAG: flagellar motor switch protein FliM [Vampirovibrionales bacterium]|nr:flagellar motor switch protein FliM [Vampirovibrionales bacterium]
MLTQDEIDNLLSTLNGIPAAQPPAEPTPAVSHSAAAPANAAAVNNFNAASFEAEHRLNYKLYNFRRPDKFSKDHLRALQSIHENFSRQMTLKLTTFLRMPLEVDVVSVDQLTYDEFVRSMPSPMTVCIMEFVPLPGQILLGIGHEVTSSIINRLLGGPGQSEVKPRELTDIEQSLMKRVIDKTTSSLEEAWRSMINVSANIVGMEDSYALIQVASNNEIVALITFEVNLGTRDSGLMSLCIPYPVLESILEQLNSQQIFHQKQKDNDPNTQFKMLDKLRHADLPVRVILGGTQISFQELLKLSVNDVIQLDQQITDDLLVCVNHQPKFYARPGTLKNNLAVAVANPVDDIEKVDNYCWRVSKNLLTERPPM